MAVDIPPSIPECVFLEESSGMKIYGLKKTLLFCYEPKIKIISVGIENELETRNIILMGATGAGKTRLIDALVNHIFDVKFEDNYRYILKDEIGNNQKSNAESQTEYVVGYLIYTRPGSSRTHNYLIIDTPGFKDSRGQQREEEVVQQIRTFLQDVDGVDELHSIGFVVNGTTTRIQDHFKEVVGNFCEVFGENAKEIIRIFISFANMKKPPVLDVLDCSCLKEYHRYKFDNVSLCTCNQANEEYSEDEIAVSKLFWNSTAKVYDSVLNELNGAKAVSLGMTRETLNEIKHLHESIDKIKSVGETYLSEMLNLRKLEEECKMHQSIMTANQNWKEIVTVRKRKVKHVRLFDKKGTEEIIHQDKKNLYDQAERNESIVREQMSLGSERSNQRKKELEETVQEMISYSEKLKETSLKRDQLSPQDYLEHVLTQVKMDSLEDSNFQEQKGQIAPIMEDLRAHFTTIFGFPLSLTV